MFHASATLSEDAMPVAPTSTSVWSASLHDDSMHHRFWMQGLGDSCFWNDWNHWDQWHASPNAFGFGNESFSEIYGGVDTVSFSTLTLEPLHRPPCTDRRIALY